MLDIKEFKNTLINADCMQILPQMADNSVNFSFCDIPYECITDGYKSLSKKQGSFKKYWDRFKDNKDIADKLTFDLADFVRQIYRVSSNSFVIFASEVQCGQIAQMLKSDEFKGTQRLLIWEKTNAAPLNAKTHYLRGLESAIWFKKKGAKVFNAFYKNTIFRYPIQPNQIHPTEKNHKLLAELILDNTNENDIVLDATAGSGSTALVALNLNRQFIAIEKHKPYAQTAYKRICESYKEKYCDLFFKIIEPRYIES